jgi:hypothetical protein
MKLILVRKFEFENHVFPIGSRGEYATKIFKNAGVKFKEE